MSVMVKMADPKILFHFVSDLGNGLIPLYLIGGQLSTPRGLSHDAVLDLTKTQKFAVLLSEVAFICKDFLYGIFGMATAGHTEREKGAVVERGRGHLRSQNEPITGINGGMLFHAKVGLVVLDRPVGIEIARKFHRLSQPIQAALRRFLFDLFFPQFVLTDGMTRRLHQAGIDGNAFIDGQSPGGELGQEFMVSLDSRLLNREKVL